MTLLESSLQPGSARVRRRVSACCLEVRVYIVRCPAPLAPVAVDVGAGGRECSVSLDAPVAPVASVDTLTETSWLGFVEFIGDGDESEGEEVGRTKFESVGRLCSVDYGSAAEFQIWHQSREPSGECRDL